MQETVSVSVVKGTYKKGDRKGQTWYALSTQVGEYQAPLVFFKSNFERKYVLNQLKEAGYYDGEVE